MSKNLTMTVLLDFYGELLTDKQRQALVSYYDEDCSLSEIAENMSISRQGARDFIKRGEAQLLEFEEKLGLASRFMKINQLVDELEKSNLPENVQKLIDEIKNNL
ncbi:MAG: YlxM family DNA-binding protein [Clostridia bacterium]|nr:YlxM family DNA-binding protein [Clostridia bacterium]